MASRRSLRYICSAPITVSLRNLLLRRSRTGTQRGELMCKRRPIAPSLRTAASTAWCSTARNEVMTRSKPQAVMGVGRRSAPVCRNDGPKGLCPFAGRASDYFAPPLWRDTPANSPRRPSVLIHRRAFMAGALTFLASPLAAEAQETGKVYRIGVLSAEVLPPGLLQSFQE